MTDKLLGREVGRYQIEELIGEGAMASVYRAFDPEINRSVACKVLKSDHCVDEEYMSRFLLEAKAAGSLSHSSIVTVFDVGRIDDRPYIMMELLHGSDLNDVLKTSKTVGIRETITIALQLAKGLDYAHNQGIVHRDVKPDNIMIFPDGETVKIADFGIARMNENEEAQKTQVGSVLGTPRYMSPEQALGESVDGRSDLFSVGTIIYEMLTGKKAFDANNMGALMMQIAQQQPEPIKKLNPNVPTGLRQIVQKLLQKSPEKRFQTGAELAQALVKELRAYSDQEEEQKRHKYMPLKVKWTLSAVAAVSLVMVISMLSVFSHQSDAMTKQAVDSGSSFARFVAIETAVPLLGEDWVTLEVFIKDASSRDTFEYLIVTDREGIVRGASNTNLVGEKYEPAEEAEFLSKTEDIYTTITSTEDGIDVFNISTPVLFQNTEIGHIVVGLSQESLEEVKSITGWLMFLLAVITINSVALIVFIITGLISKPLGSLKEAICSIRDGDLDSRISLTRKDEFGVLFEVFNEMALSIQSRYTKVSDELAQSGIQLPEKPVSNPFGNELQNQDNDEVVDDATILTGNYDNNQKLSDDDSTIIATSNINLTSPNQDGSAEQSNDVEEATVISKSAIFKPTEKALKEDEQDPKTSNDEIDVASQSEDSIHDGLTEQSKDVEEATVISKSSISKPTETALNEDEQEPNTSNDEIDLASQSEDLGQDKQEYSNSNETNDDNLQEQQNAENHKNELGADDFHEQQKTDPDNSVTSDEKKVVTKEDKSSVSSPRQQPIKSLEDSQDVEAQQKEDSEEDNIAKSSSQKDGG